MLSENPSLVELTTRLHTYIRSLVGYPELTCPTIPVVSSIKCLTRRVKTLKNFFTMKCLPFDYVSRPFPFQLILSKMTGHLNHYENLFKDKIISDKVDIKKFYRGSLQSVK